MTKKTVAAKVEYDFVTDTFYAFPIKRDYQDSFQKDDIIFDLSSTNEIVGFELLNASKNFNLSKTFLKNIVGGTIILETTSEKIKMTISLQINIRNQEKSGVLQVEKIKPSFISPSELRLAIS